MKICLYPQAVLFKVSRHIPSPDEVRPIIRDMFDLMYFKKGVGLAAPQVGIPWRFAVVNSSGDRQRQDLERVWINPVVLSTEGEQKGSEGCLSVPQAFGQVMRPMRVKLEWTDLEGARHQEWLEGFDARVACHETDHLDGVLVYMTDARKPRTSVRG